MAFPSSARERSASVLSLTSAPLHKMQQQQQHPHHFAAGTQRVSFPGAALNLNMNVGTAPAFPAPPHRPRADSNVSAATLAQFNYATYMYYLSVATLLSQAPSSDAAARGPGHAAGHMRVHSTASTASLRSMSLSSTASSSPDSAWAPGSARDGVLTPDTCSDIASDDDGTGCPLSELPTSCADTPVEGHPPACAGRESQSQRAQHAKLASLAAAATLRTRPTPPPPVLPSAPAPTKPAAVAAAFWSDDGLPLAARYDTASFHRLRSPFADGLWWECVTHEKPWAPLATPIAKSEMPAVPLRRLSGLRINTRGDAGPGGNGRRNSGRRRPSRAASASLAATPR